MAYTWGDLPSDSGHNPSDPWSTWVLGRQGSAKQFWSLCEGTKEQTPALFKADSPHANIPPVYANDAAFFTARTPFERVRPNKSPEVGSRGPVESRGPSLDRVVPALELASKQLQWPGLMWQRFAGFIGLEKFAAAPAPKPSALLAPAAPPLRKERAVPVTPPAAGSAAMPVIAIVDTDIAFLHEMFRESGKPTGTRILSFWDQEDVTPQEDWRVPPLLGYGREISQASIQNLLRKVQQHPEHDERPTYRAQGVSPIPEYGHGTHVLALAAGLLDPLGTSAADAASALPIIAVQLPKSAVRNTHGRWLDVLLLDALHYILDKAPPDSPVIVNVSMGSYSGPHDGSGMFDRAIDNLIQSQNGRLTVVVATGNGREEEAHARVTLGPATAGEPGQASLGICVEANDPTPNFIELWYARPAAAGTKSLTFTLAFPSAAGLSKCRAVDDAKPDQQVLWSKDPGQSNKGQLVALLQVAPNGAVGGRHGATALAGIGPGDTALPNVKNAPAGLWVLNIENHSATVVHINAWIARDDTLDNSTTQRRQKKLLRIGPICDGPSEHVLPTGTMSSLAWARNVVAVGGYTAGADLTPVDMYSRSGSGFAAGHPESADGRRAGPDLCALADIEGNACIPPVSFVSRGEQQVTICPEGTSLAAPMVTRRLANIFAAERSFIKRDDLLALLKKKHPMTPGVNISPANETEWTSSYWLPVHR